MLPRLPQPHGGDASAQRGPHTRPSPPPPQLAGHAGKEGRKAVPPDPSEGKREPRGRAGKSRRGRPEPRHRKRSPGPYGAPTLRRALKGREGARSCPGKPTARAPRLARPPAAQPRRARASSPRRSAPCRGRGSPPPPAPRDPPETPEESCAARGPERRPPRAPPLTAPRRGFGLSGVVSPASAQAPEPPLGPLTPGRPDPRRPQSRALSAPAAPWVPVGAAPRDAPLQPRAALLRAGRAGGWVRGVGEGGRRAGRGRR